MVNVEQLKLKYKTLKGKKLKLTIKIKPSNPRAIADKWVLDHYGNFCSLGKPKFIGENMEFPILADMPIRIDDEDTIFYRWLSIGEIGKLIISQKEPFKINAPSFLQLISKIRSKYNQFRDWLEYELINAAEFRFALIDDVKKPYLNPFLILIHLLKESIDAGEKDEGIPLSKILKLYGNKNYIDFFVTSGLVYIQETREGKKIFPSEIMLVYREQASKDNRYSFEDRCLGKIIITHYNELARISPGLKSYARFTYSLFEASFERQKLLKVTPETWVDKLYTYRYGKPSNRENMRIWYPQKLEQAGIIDRYNGKYSPNEEVYEAYIKRIMEKWEEYATLDMWGI